MKVGDYIRTKKGNIYQFNSTSSKALSGAKKYMVKSSPNIIDLIKKHDFVNGHQVLIIKIDKQRDTWTIVLDNQEILIGNHTNSIRPIKSVVTKEQFESMQYNLESEVN